MDTGQTSSPRPSSDPDDGVLLYPADDSRSYRRRSNLHPGQAIASLSDPGSRWIRARITVKGRVVAPEVLIYADRRRQIDQATGSRSNGEGAWPPIVRPRSGGDHPLQTKVFPLIGSVDKAVGGWTAFFRSRAMEPEVVKA